MIRAPSDHRALAGYGRHMRNLSLLLLMYGATAAAEPDDAFEAVAAPAARAATPPPSGLPWVGEADAVLRLSVRDPAPTCEQALAGVPEPTAVLRHIVDTVNMPPWVPMRAAACLLRDPSTPTEVALSWVSHPDKRGLALLVLALRRGSRATAS